MPAAGASARCWSAPSATQIRFRLPALGPRAGAGRAAGAGAPVAAGERIARGRSRLDQRSRRSRLRPTSVTEAAPADRQRGAPRRSQPGRVLSERDLQPPRLVTRGRAVQLVYARPGLQLRALGIAQADGALGELGAGGQPRQPAAAPGRGDRPRPGRARRHRAAAGDALSGEPRDDAAACARSLACSPLLALGGCANIFERLGAGRRGAGAQPDREPGRAAGLPAGDPADAGAGARDLPAPTRSGARARARSSRTSARAPSATW